MPVAGTVDHSRTIWRLTARAEPIVVMNEGSFDPRIYCIHSVTGDVAGLNPFAERFGPMRLHGLQVPKRDMTLHLTSTIEAMARHHVALLEAFQERGPIHLIGWSAGAIVALEMAQQLRARGRDVPLLVALDGAPCNTGAGVGARDPRRLLRVIANLPRWIRDDLATSDWSIGGIRTRLEEKLAAARGARILGDVDTLEIDAVERAISRPGWSPAQKAFVRAMVESMAAYVPSRYVGEVLVFEAETQPLLHVREIGAAWRAIAEAVEIVPVRGNHSGLIHPATASFLAEQVTLRLARSLSGVG